MIHAPHRRLGAGAITALVLASAATAQIERPIPYPIPRDNAWAGAVDGGTRTDAGAPGADYWTNYAKYSIDASLDPKTAKVSGKIEMTYENRSPKSIRSLSIHLRQNAHKAGNLRNRYLEITGGVEVRDLRVDGESVEVGGRRRRDEASARITGTVMTLSLPERLRSGDSVTMSMNWSYQVPKRGAPRNGHEDFHTYYLAYWYPQFAVFEDVGGWVAEQYRTNAEFYMGYADYDIRFTAPKGFLVRATGALQNAEDTLTKASRKRLEKARGGRDIVHVLTEEDLEKKRVTRMDKGKTLTWHYTASNVRDCAVSVSDRYLWDASHAVIDDRDGPGKDGKSMIHAVYHADDKKRFDRAAEYARHTIEHMSRLIYPYPWDHMTVCGGVIGGGMEFPMMTICGNGGLGLVTHELVHMWFPMIVGTNEKARAWQDEGFTSFFTTVTTAAFRQKEENRRMDVQSYLRTAARGEPAPLMRHGDQYPDRGSYGAASYNKSKAVLHQLRDLVGEETFYSTFRQYAADWAFKHPHAQDFFNAFCTGASQDLSWYFRTWYYETWTLDQAIDSVVAVDGGTDVTVVDKKYATYPTTVAVTYADGRTESKAIEASHWLSGKKSKTLRFDADVQRVELNPGKVTLDLSRRNNVWKK